MKPHQSGPIPARSRKSANLRGEVHVPGDKSISHRALLFGALAEGRTEIKGLLEGDDVLRTAEVLRAMGVNIEKRDDIYVVIGAGLGGLIQPEVPLDFGNSGTGVRLMMGAIGGHPVSAELTGDASLQRRPMGRVLGPLKTMGASVEGERATLPLTLYGTSNLVPIEYALPVPSAQVKSAILIAGLLAPGVTTVIEKERTRDHTEKMLAYLGASIETKGLANGTTAISIKGQSTLTGRPITVPGDPSSAAFLTAAALLCDGSDIVIRNVLMNPTRTGFYETLAEMGASIDIVDRRSIAGEEVADLRVRSSRLHGITVPADRAPSMIDEYPCLSAIAALAEGDTIMHGLGELRVKESDRLAATVAGLRACGAMAEAYGDTLIVHGQPRVRGGGIVQTHMDHRIAMSFLILGLATEEPVTVDDISMIATSFPEFPQLLSSLGGQLEFERDDRPAGEA